MVLAQTVYVEKTIVEVPIMRKGLLKIRPVTAHLTHNEGFIIDRMSPFVIIKINGFEVYRNEPNYDGGKRPEWGPRTLEHIVVDMFHEVEILVLDKDMFGADMIGHAKCRLDFFCRAGEMNEWLELKFGFDFNAGRIHMRSEFFPEMGMGMEGGMAMEGGRGGMGVGGAVLAGAAIGTMAAIDIAEHDNRNRRGPEVVVVNEGHHHHRGPEVVVVNEGRHHGRR
jgi:hypothetical protein